MTIIFRRLNVTPYIIKVYSVNNGIYNLSYELHYIDGVFRIVRSYNHFPIDDFDYYLDMFNFNRALWFNYVRNSYSIEWTLLDEDETSSDSSSDGEPNVTLINDPVLTNAIEETFNAQQPVQTVNMKDLPPFFVSYIETQKNNPKDASGIIKLTNTQYRKLNRVLNIQPIEGIIQRDVKGKSKKSASPPLRINKLTPTQVSNLSMVPGFLSQKNPYIVMSVQSFNPKNKQKAKPSTGIILQLPGNEMGYIKVIRDDN